MEFDLLCDFVDTINGDINVLSIFNIDDDEQDDVDDDDDIDVEFVDALDILRLIFFGIEIEFDLVSDVSKNVHVKMRLL